MTLSRTGKPQAKHTPQPLEDEFGWRQHAKCHGADAETFFPHKGDTASAKAAKQICRDCTVRNPCLQYALQHNEIHGVWGGRSATERRELLRRKTA